MYRNPGSYRDPAGAVLHHEERVFRSVSSHGARQFEFVAESGLFDDLIQKGLLVPFQRCDLAAHPDLATEDVVYLLELQKLDFISYPYEWSFCGLRDAALTHLEIQSNALKLGIVLTDATPFNIQFVGSRPVFIDHLSFRRYVDGELWYGHRQFCEQFLNPLLLTTHTGISHHAWLRSNIEGIPVDDLNRLLPWYKKLSPNMFFHVTLHARLQNKHRTTKDSRLVTRKLPRQAYQNMLRQLHGWISKLPVPASDSSIWSGYADNNVYEADESLRKQTFIQTYASTVRPRVIWDLGCNTGEYASTCLRSGTELAIGFDADPAVLDLAHMKAKKAKLNFLPLYMDFTNPSPSQGWREMERMGLSKRAKPDGLLALALLHHLVIARNIPFDEVIDWLLDIAPTGVIEFVPKNDPMVKRLLTNRQDIFPQFTEATFRSLITRRAYLVREERLTRDGRLLIWYERDMSRTMG